MKEKRAKRGGRILLGDNTGDGALVWRPIQFQGTVISILTSHPFVFYGWSNAFSLPTCPKFDLPVYQKHMNMRGSVCMDKVPPSNSEQQTHYADFFRYLPQYLQVNGGAVMHIK